MTDAAGDGVADTAPEVPRLHLAAEPRVVVTPLDDGLATAKALADAEAERRRDAERALSGLYRRVLELEADAVAKDATIRALQREIDLRMEELATTYAAVEEHWPRSLELEALHATKTFRWTSGPRRIYGLVLRTRRR